MSRRAPRSRNVPQIGRFLVCFLAITALVIGSVTPLTTASATASSGTTADLARAVGDGPDTAIVPTALAGFTPGNLMSDAVFYNKGTMSEAQIQAFLNTKVPTCKSGYTCLKSWTDATRNIAANEMCGAYSGGGQETAARIIYKVAQACGINPQVILVTLQKEQSLVTHTTPTATRFKIAMGQGCPDTAACDTAYYGFFNQVYGAAKQFKRYSNPPGTSNYFTWYAPGKTWNLRFHPNVSCGTSPVYIQNQATANLYYYTPYQPNPAALKAGYGTGDSCSSYGNRNFYNYFTDWFGSTQTPAVAGPTLASMNTTPVTVALASNGTLWGYPFAKSAWGPRVALATGLTGVKKVVSVGDLDGDGHKDLVAFSASGEASVLYGNGTTSYPAPVALNGVGKNAVLTTAAGDFDGDGVPDLFTTDAAGNLMLWRGDDRGGFRNAVQVGRGWDVMNLISGGVDMDGDGNVDLVARDTAGRLWLYPGNGKGGWKYQVQIGHGWGSFVDVFAMGDFTGDGKPDVGAVAANGTLLAYQGTGGGRLGGATTVGTGWDVMSSVSHGGAGVTRSRALAPGVGDVDRQLGRDVITVSNTGDLVLYGGNGRAGWTTPRKLSSGWVAGDRMYPLGDFTGDGLTDLARIDASGDFRLLSGKPDGTFSASVSIGKGWSGYTIIATGIDFDGDRKPDVLARNSSGDLLLYRGNGAGGWLGAETRIGTGWGVIDASFYAGDFDGDGNGDILARRKDGTLWLYGTNGNGGWGATRQVGQGWSGMTALFSPGDFDGDGKTDVLARDADGRLFIYRGDGKGSWLASTAIGKGWNSIALLG